MEKVRIGVIGCGVMGRSHLTKLKEVPLAELTAVADAFPESARKAGAEFGVPAYGDYRELISSGRCDAVLIATPHYFHPEIGLAAFQAGLHVLCEKPIAVTVREADALVAAAEKSGRVFAVNFQMRTVPEIRFARRLLAEGRLGEIRRTMVVENAYRTQAYYDSAGWRGTWIGEGGGVLINQAPHGIDLFLLLGGLPSRVLARTRTSRHDIEVEDEACALLEYPNGAWGYYYASTSELPIGHRIEVVGDRDRLVYSIRDDQYRELKFQSFNPPLSKHISQSPEMWTGVELKDEPIELPAVETGHGEIIRNFCAAILHGEALLSPGREGLWSVEFINSLILSGHRGREVSWPTPRDEYDQLLAELKKNSRLRQVAPKTASKGAPGVDRI
ncbi:MAG TPA: Gfo/Idh/MocA family oxidoreductase [bacterium]|nr:Gfo/Idh/MocA family oxidoreductase [bacterium]